MATYLFIISFVLPTFNYSKMIVIVVIAIFVINGYFAVRPRFYTACALVLVSVPILAAFFASLGNGGLDGFVTPIMIVGPVAAALFLGVRSALATCAVVILGFLVQVYLQQAGMIAPPAFSEGAVSIAALVLLSITVTLCTAASTLSTHTRNQLLEQLIEAYDAVSKAESEANELREVAERQRLKAEQASQVKTDFLANISHELRTPLNGVIGMAQLLERSELSDDQLRYANLIRTSGNSLLDMINGLLDIAKIEAGQTDFAPEALNPQDLIEMARNTVASLAEQKGLLIKTRIDNSVPETVYGDPRLLQSILVNLIANAIKFTDEGSVTIALELDDNQSLHFQVIDTGIGIAEDEQLTIFNLFEQAESSGEKKSKGTGLGLSICRDLVELMGGEIGVRGSLGEGSTFWFTVPQAGQQTTADWIMNDQMNAEQRY